VIYTALFFGIFCGAFGMAALLLILGANRPPSTTMHARRPPHPMPKYDDRMRSLSEPMPQCKEGRKPDFWGIVEADMHCINCGLRIDPRCACERGRKLAAEHEQENTVRYEFLGITGHEEE